MFITQLKRRQMAFIVTMGTGLSVPDKPIIRWKLINLLRYSRDGGGLRQRWRPVCLWLMITHIELGAMCKGYWGLTQPKSAGPPQHCQPTPVPTRLALFLGRWAGWNRGVPVRRLTLTSVGQPPGPQQSTEDSDKRPLIDIHTHTDKLSQSFLCHMSWCFSGAPAILAECDAQSGTVRESYSTLSSGTVCRTLNVERRIEKSDCAAVRESHSMIGCPSAPYSEVLDEAEGPLGKWCCNQEPAVLPDQRLRLGESQYTIWTVLWADLDAFHNNDVQVNIRMACSHGEL
ncbi:hypothetical protein F2P79_008803 [Pimephales promelas]|nr:hypothetical protein F2P79_008803 [Pimephales promelas]